ncbi:xylosidase : arabinofuranosidase [Xylaria telfairii]|nr:xylosidase : arabinofuranosidase [Xylaria telfairii]
MAQVPLGGHAIAHSKWNLAQSRRAPVQTSTYVNPILPGWHSDPSCTFIPEWDDVFLCATSTFLAFPGIPIYSSRDLVTWRLVSHVFNRREQLPKLAQASYQSDGIYAPTLRFHNGTLYLATSFLSGLQLPRLVIFSTVNPYDDNAWSDPIDVAVSNYGYDPDLFWDDDGQLYVSFAGYNTTRDTEIIQATFNLETMETGNWSSIWGGTGAPYPEGPHIYKKDGLYYLLVAEGGTDVHHSVAIAHSSSVSGPYHSYTRNPILTANDTANYFQTVGHADLFQDKAGNWWGMALATRSGPKFTVYPMGREAVLFSGTWEEGGWPELKSVEGSMSGPLPVKDGNPPGTGPFVDDGDSLDFAPGSELPKQFLTWRPQPKSLFTVSPSGHPNTLRIAPSRANLTGDGSFIAGNDSQAFISRLQSATFFNFSVEITFQPRHKDEEAGVSVFLTQLQHIDLGIVLLSSNDGNLSPRLRFRAETSGLPGVAAPKVIVRPVPSEWLSAPIRLRIWTPDNRTFAFSAAPASHSGQEINVGSGSAEIVSGGEGKFTGALLGSYATSNGGNGTSPSYLRNWIYTPIAQQIDIDTIVDI